MKSELLRGGLLLSERLDVEHRFRVVGELAAAMIAFLMTGSFDLIFLDADRPNYMAYLGPLLMLLRRGGLLVTDNVTSHAHEVEDFLGRLKADPALETVTVPLGNDEELTYRR